MKTCVLLASAIGLLRCTRRAMQRMGCMRHMRRDGRRVWRVLRPPGHWICHGVRVQARNSTSLNMLESLPRVFCGSTNFGWPLALFHETGRIALKSLWKFPASVYAVPVPLEESVHHVWDVQGGVQHGSRIFARSLCFLTRQLKAADRQVRN